MHLRGKEAASTFRYHSIWPAYRRDFLFWLSRPDSRRRPFSVLSYLTLARCPRRAVRRARL